VQTRAGVLEAARHVGGVIRPEIPEQARSFLAGQQLAVMGTVDARGRPWASLLTGERGFVRATGPRTLYLGAHPEDDPLAGTLAAAHAAGTPVDAGVVVIDLATRRRLRVNGAAETAADGGIILQVRHAFWICPKYIQARVVEPHPPADPPEEGPPPSWRSGLTDAQRAWIARADTFFIATAHPTAGADASHRGGEPGFVQLSRNAAGGDVLVFPDYPGNNMFNTFGNLAIDPAAGLLFIDFDSGATLQLTGTAQVLWEREEFAAFPGARRAVSFRVAEALESPQGTRLRWRLIQRSPFNPPPPRAHGDTEAQR
jgi:hypothetical protein